MTATTTLLEPSFVDLIAAIEQAAELSEQTRRHWVCSARQIARWLDRPAAVIPARWNSVQISRRPIASRPGRRHREDPGKPQIQCPGGAALVRQGARRAAAGVRLSPDWARFRDGLDNRRLRDRLYSLIRYCSARGIGPGSVDDKIFDEYWRYRTETTALAIEQ